jgi:uncharacterized membrane protein YhaH (DUF805 family)
VCHKGNTAVPAGDTEFINLLRNLIRQPISAPRFFAYGLALFALKFQLDRLIAHLFHRQWLIFDYWGAGSYSILTAERGASTFLLAMALVALPFVAIGVVLTIRRLRAVHWPVWLSLLFFVPAFNLLFFLVLVAWPTHPGMDVEDRGTMPLPLFEHILPGNQLPAAVTGVLATIPYAVIMVLLSTTILKNYSSGLFLGLPFVMGFVATAIYNAKRRHSLGSSLFVAMCSVLLLGVMLTIIAVEGVMCLFMAVPIAVPLALCGSLVAYCVCRANRSAPPGFALGIVLLLPGFLVSEHAASRVIPEFAVRTSVVVHAPPEVVWKNLIAFAPLSEPREWFFRAGIAYPTRAQIYGSGVAATRLCIFSTGAFVEPIRVWDQPRMLAFDVESQPAAMRELSPYRHLDPVHLHGDYLRSRQGQFLLKSLPDGDTELEGTTWYDLRFWPSAYWRLWSDAIIHRIHERVLNQIKLQAEKK